jgi:hypothetical protein
VRRVSKRDPFPVYLAFACTVLVLSTVALVLRHHPVLAIFMACVSLLVALTLGGWLVAGPYLEACMVVTLRANGGHMPRRRLVAPGSTQDDLLLPHLLRKGVVSVSDEILFGETIFLHEEQVGRVLALFIRVRLAK